jgi:hypothetical protein
MCTRKPVGVRCRAMFTERRTWTRREACGLMLLGAVGVTAACAAPAPGNRRVMLPTQTAEDDKLAPSAWKTTAIKVGEDVGRMAALHFIQDLQLPRPRLPFVTSMTFYAPRETPFVTIGIYYERNADNAQVRDILTSSAFGLQRITDPDSPLSFDPAELISVESEHVDSQHLEWFAAHRQSIVDAMRASPEGMALSKTYDSNFTTRPRPSSGEPVAMVITGGNYAGLQLPYTPIGQRLVFLE